MIQKLFSSQARVEVLKLLLFNPGERFYQREIAVRAGLPIRAVQRELRLLQETGLVTESVEGKRIYYTVNRDAPIFEELKRMFFKTVGVAEVLKKYFEKMESEAIIFIYGSFAAGEETAASDIDLMVIGDISSRRLSGVLAPVKSELNREINYAVMSADEFRKRFAEKDHFLRTVLKGEKIFIRGSERELKELSKPR